MQESLRGRTRAVELKQPATIISNISKDFFEDCSRINKLKALLSVSQRVARATIAFSPQRAKEINPAL
jgi:hypothetical protein